jgi:hypothetical protein
MIARSPVHRNLDDDVTVGRPNRPAASTLRTASEGRHDLGTCPTRLGRRSPTSLKHAPHSGRCSALGGLDLRTNLWPSRVGCAAARRIKRCCPGEANAAKVGGAARTSTVLRAKIRELPSRTTADASSAVGEAVRRTRSLELLLR